MEIIICNDVSGYSQKVDFSINKMNRQSYDQLCACGYLEKHPHDLYLIDDDNFDVQFKRIINVALPESDSDVINRSYLKTNYVSLTEQKYYPDSKIATPNGLSCISADCCLYYKEMGRSDWTIVEVTPLCLDWQISDFYVIYSETAKQESGKGFSFKINKDKYSSILFRSGEKDETKQELTSIITDDSTTYQNIYFRAIRNTWSKYDSLLKHSDLSNESLISSVLSNYIKKSTVKDCLSALSSENIEVGDIYNALSSLLNKCN